MELLITGVVLFFGIHTISIVALPLRNKLAAMSELGWKLIYSIISIIGIILIIKGYTEYKQLSPVIYVSPIWLRYVSAVLLLPVFILILAPYFPGKIKNSTKHPQLIALKLWAMAHLLTNGALADIILFASFLTWAVVNRISMKRRDTRPVPGAPESSANDMILIVLGLALYGVTVIWLHQAISGMELTF